MTQTSEVVKAAQDRADEKVREAFELLRGETLEPIADAVRNMKREADEKVGELKGRLNACGPRGNRSVEASLDMWMGRAGALHDVQKIVEILAR